MDITFMMWVGVFLLCVLQHIRLGMLQREHETFERVAAFAFRDLHWRGVKETATGLTLDCEQSVRDAARDNVIPFHKDQLD